MLDALRKGAGTWVAKIFIALLILSFAVWGIADIFRNFGSNVVAKVGDTEISVVDFDLAYRRELNAVSRQIGRPLSTTEGAQFGVPQQVLARMIAEAAMNDMAADMNLGISDEELRRMIQENPAFQRGGGYDRNSLVQLLRANGISEDDFVREQRLLAGRQQIAGALTDNIKTPEAMLSAFNIFENETRTVRYIAVPPSAAGEIAAPTEEELQSFYETRKEDFRAPEYRSLSILQLLPQTLAKPDDVTDEEAKQAYDRSANRFRTVEQRRVLQMPFPDSAAAEAAAAEIASGVKTFAQLMEERGLKDSDVDLGMLAKDKFLDPAIAEAAFALPQGGTSGAVQGRFTTVIVQVAEIQPEAVRPFDEVKAELKQEIALEKAEQEVQDLHDEIEDARAGGATLAEVAGRFSLTTTEIPAVDSNGRDEAGQPVTLPEADGLLGDAFESDVGIENNPLPLGQRGFVWFDVTKVTPARDRDLSEVRDAVVQAWTEKERDQKLLDISADMATRVRGGEALDAVAAAAGLEVKTSDAFKRNGQPAGLPQEAVEEAFSGPTGTVLDTMGADGGRLVMVVDSVSAPAFFREEESIKQIDTQISEQLSASLLNLVINKVEAEKGVEINQQALQLVIGGPSQN
ncbi:SurA N-terminal domain-containing protein [Pannonibacter phragmitetus]|uniref:peptidylprolyl isomerase n=1 Tax=Pannonibacter phragmitetus TaxID=121719 RepID=UPI003D2F437A